MKRLKKILSLILISMVAIMYLPAISFATESAITWDPNNKGADVDLYDDNFTVGGAGTYTQNVTTTDNGYSSGKYYWEITVTSGDLNAVTDDAIIGVKDVLKQASDSMDANISYISRIDTNTNPKVITAGTTIGILLDLDNHVLKYQNSNGLSSGEVQLKTGITYKPAICATGTEIRVTANFGLSTFKLPLPEGYKPYQSETTDPEIRTLKVVLGVGESLQLSVNNDLDVNAKMSWFSDDNSIATVDANGIATGVKSGSTIITVTNADGTYKETINLLVINDETDLQLAIDLRVGDTRRLTVDDLTDTVSAIWSSNSNAIATVSDTGKVTAVGVGTTYVTVTDDQGNEIGKICVRVRK